MTARAKTGIFGRALDRGEANFQALTPLSFLERTAAVYPEKTAVIHVDTRYSYAQFHQRCRRLASALRQRGIAPGDTVSVVAPNVPAMLECHYGVPMTSQRSKGIFDRDLDRVEANYHPLTPITYLE